MGEVYLARQRHPEREVAVKLISGRVADPGLRARFALEVKALARLRHPGIAQIFSAGMVAVGGDSIPYLVMEYVDGLPLREAVTRMPLEERVRLLAAIARAVEHAHRCGVIHRDLKPANILVTAEGQPKILDFGVARVIAEEGEPLVDSKLTHAGFMVGTLAYMSPEQTRTDRDEVDTRSDVYALGLLGYEILAGRLPYELPPDQYGMVQVIREQPPIPLARLLPRAPRDLATILEKALAKDREQRYASAGAMAEDLERFLARQPIAARPASTWYRLRKFAERNPLATAALAGAGLSLLLSVAAILAFALREQAARLAAEEAHRRANAHLDFVRGVLSQANPALADSVNVTVGEALKAASRMVAESYADTPELEVELRVLLGNLWLSLDRWSDAIPEFEAALARGREHFAPDDRQLLIARSERAQAIGLLGDLRTARRELAETLVAMSRTMAPDDPALLDARRAMVRLRFDLDDTAGLKEELADLVARLGTPRDRASRELAVELDNLRALRAMRDGELEEGLALRLQALERAKAYFGPDGMPTLLATENLAAAYDRLGRTEEAIALLEGLAEEMRKRLGENHQVTLRVRNMLAVQWLKRGELERAGREAEALLAALDRAGVQGRVRGGVLSLLTNVHYSRGEYERALLFSEQAVSLALSEYGEEHEETIRAMISHANVLLGARRTDEAATWFERMLAATRRRYGPEHPGSLAASGEYAAFLRDQGRLEEAIALFAETLPVSERRLGPRHEQTLLLKYQYAGALQRAGRFAEAEKLSAEVLAGAPALGEASALALLAPNRHARSLLGLGRLAEAERLLRASWKTMADRGAPAEWRSWVADSLAEVAGRKGDEEAAERWRRRARALREGR
ncbi:MAG: serine/threonine-protein kinase [Xanthomonadales bacterium]|nr:serine/threonine-protein kinase [Xanthomonadales bacterium]